MRSSRNIARMSVCYPIDIDRVTPYSPGEIVHVRMDWPVENDDNVHALVLTVTRDTGPMRPFCHLVAVGTQLATMTFSTYFGRDEDV